MYEVCTTYDVRSFLIARTGASGKLLDCPNTQKYRFHPVGRDEPHGMHHTKYSVVILQSTFDLDSLVLVLAPTGPETWMTSQRDETFASVLRTLHVVVAFCSCVCWS